MLPNLTLILGKARAQVLPQKPRVDVRVPQRLVLLTDALKHLLHSPKLLQLLEVNLGVLPLLSAYVLLCKPEYQSSHRRNGGRSK